MKIKKFNENWIRRKLNKDEDIAEGIYDNLLTSDIIESEIKLTHFNNTCPEDRDMMPKYISPFTRKTGRFTCNYEPSIYEINLENFKLESVKFNPRDTDYSKFYQIFIDELKLEASNSIAKKIFNEIDALKKGKRKNQYTLKDARDKFIKKKINESFFKKRNRQSNQEKTYTHISLENSKEYGLSGRNDNLTSQEINHIKKLINNNFFMCRKELTSFDNRMCFKILPFIGEEIIVDISKYKDEWFVVMILDSKGQNFYLCDQFDSLVQCIENNS